MLQGFRRIIENLSFDDQLFLGNFIGHDSHGVLTVFCAYIFMHLGTALASKLIIALYRPGAFFAFYIRAVPVIFPFRTSPFGFHPLAQLYEPNVRPIRFRPLRH